MNVPAAPSPSAPATPGDLIRRLPELMVRDQRRLRRRVERARKLRDNRARAAALADLSTEVEAAERTVARRRSSVPAISYPSQLPVSERRNEIAAAIRDHQVVVVAGETGSGKTTQLPKICLDLGRGVAGMIGHTQPRRLAARTVAERIAEELGQPLGEAIGYRVRFTDQVGADSLVKVMTDGILLEEIHRDPLLTAYDTLIVDEAHERSLNIDFILGYVRQLLPRRPDLKLIITSATIDPERFSRYFGDAPIVEVSGRTYPVEVRYRPVVDPDADPDDPAADPDRDQIQAIGDAVDELCAEGPGDILVFCSGEREIRDTADALSRRADGAEVLPLYARLSAAEQHRVFAPHAGRRIVLATNVAETSLTVPGIKYVVDPGTARISRYSHRTKVQRLPIEPISQASANQRKGRCGRTSAGICIRLYTEADFVARPEYTDPEILRTNLASVILQMAVAGLGDVAAFGFIDPPDRRNVADGVALLAELGALDPTQADPAKRLTAVGRKLARLPVDPRLGRMVLAAADNDCVGEVIVIAAALSIQDPRERPTEQQQAADARHARFTDPQSDFLGFLNLWRYLREQQRELSSSAFRRLCRAEFLNYLRVREWQDIVAQLRQVARDVGVSARAVRTETSVEDARGIHTSLLAGLLSHIGLKEGAGVRDDYLGARSARFAIFPGSALFKKPPRFVMAAELVETSRLWARVAARVEPEWAEDLAGHLVKRSYSEPHWERKQGAVLAAERVTLYGVPLVVDRKVNYGRIDPPLARELFIRRALVEGDWDTRHEFFHANRALLDEVGELEDRARRRDILVDDETLFDFYERRIPADVVSARHFDSWWKRERRERPDLLDYTTDLLAGDRAERVSAADYPDVWPHGELRLPLTYRFEVGAEADGVTVDVPLPLLDQVDAEEFGWLIPGLRAELVVTLIRSLPKALRRNVVPAADYARAALAALTPYDGPLPEALARELGRLAGVAIPPTAFDLSRVPTHLTVTFRVVDESGRDLGEGKDLDVLRRKLRPKVRESISAAAADIERSGLTSWDVDPIPATYRQHRAGREVTAYPALADEGSTVGVRLYDSPAEADRGMWVGTRRLVLLGVPSPLRHVLGQLDNRSKLLLRANPAGDIDTLLDDCVAAAVDHLVAAAGGPARDAAGFAAMLDRVRAGLPDAATRVVSVVVQVIGAADDLRRELNGLAVAGRGGESVADAQAHLAALVHTGFVAETGWAQLPHLPRYLEAEVRRLQRLQDNPGRDAELTARIGVVEREHAATVAALGPAGAAVAAPVRWMIEELRVSFFAQTLGTPYAISEKRIFRALDALTG